jgi:hypothetical protein
LVALGSALGGWSLHICQGQVRYVHNLYGKERHSVHSDTLLSPGEHTVVFTFEKDDGAGGEISLEIDGVQDGEGSLSHFTPAGFNGVGVGVTCGFEWGPAVGVGYEAPFAFNGVIQRAEVIATGPIVRDPVLELAAILAEQ